MIKDFDTWLTEMSLLSEGLRDKRSRWRDADTQAVGEV